MPKTTTKEDPDYCIRIWMDWIECRNVTMKVRAMKKIDLN